MSSKPITIEVSQAFDRPAHEVWSAITDRDEMILWYFDNIPDFKPEIGFETGFDVESGDNVFPHRWKILEVEPGQKISYSWAFEGFAGDGKVTFEILPDESGCTLTVTNEGVETFDSRIPEFRPESCEGGWKYFIQQRLVQYLENK